MPIDNIKLILTDHKVFVTIFKKIDHLRASTEIHFLPVQERYIHALSRKTNCLTIYRWPSLLLQAAFYRCCETTRVYFMVLGCVNRTAWGTKLFLTAVWASLVNCISSCHLLKAQHCSLSPNWCFTPPSAPHPPPTHPTPSHPPTP